MDTYYICEHEFTCNFTQTRACMSPPCALVKHIYVCLYTHIIWCFVLIHTCLNFSCLILSWKSLRQRSEWNAIFGFCFLFLNLKPIVCMYGIYLQRTFWMDGIPFEVRYSHVTCACVCTYACIDTCIYVWFSTNCVNSRLAISKRYRMFELYHFKTLLHV